MQNRGGTVKMLQIVGFVTEAPGLTGSDKLWEARPGSIHHHAHSPLGYKPAPLSSPVISSWFLTMGSASP